MTSKGVLAYIWLIITEIFAVVSVTEHLTFYSFSTAGFLLIFIIWVLVEMVRE